MASSVDTLWLLVDQAPPAWDQGDHLTRAMNHWRVIETPQLASPAWWRELWQQAPTQRAPLVYLLTTPFLMVLGRGFDQAVGVNLLFSAVLIGSVYRLGCRLFSPDVGKWAAAICLLSPTLAFLRTDYLLDYGLTALFTLCYAVTTEWWFAKKSSHQWALSLLTGLTIGLTLMTRTSGLLFLLPLLVWVIGVSLVRRQGWRLLQIGVGGAVAIATFWPWFSTNWITVISTTIESTAHGIIYRNDPQANRLAGWLFYPRALPQMLSSPILIAALVAGGLGWLNRRPFTVAQPPKAIHGNSNDVRKAWWWLAVFLISIYVLGSLGSNKQLRLLAPCLPMLTVVLAAALSARRDRFGMVLRWGSVGLSSLLLLLHLFPLTPLPRWGAVRFPYVGPQWPNPAVIAEIIDAEPLLKSTLGMAVNTSQINPQNLDFYGAVADFQVEARQLAFSPDTADADSEALNWYLTKTGDQGAYNTIEAGQAQLRQNIENSETLSIHQRWQLPDQSELRLYHRTTAPIEIVSIPESLDHVHISDVQAPPSIQAGSLAPITYHLEGPWKALQPGLLLLTWQSTHSDGQWISDHGIGLGQLQTAQTGADENSFRVIERLVLAPPPQLPDGAYSLQAIYLNRQSGEAYPIDLPLIEVTLTAADSENVSALPPASLDLMTQLRALAQHYFAIGDLDTVFNRVGQINQYDPIQAYLPQTEQALTYRLSKSPEQLNWQYTLLLAQVLQQKGSDAIATLNQITQLDPQNPYAWAYLGFVHLYCWQPSQAQSALDQATILDPDSTEVKALQAAAALMRFNIPRALRFLQAAQIL